MKTTIPIVFGALFLFQSLFAGSTIQFQTRVVTVAETDEQVILPVVRANDVETEVAVEFYSVTGTATAGQDFTAVSGTLSFAAGVTNQTILVPILNDALVESGERFQVVLTNATGEAVLGSMKTATVTIQDNDTGPYFDSATQRVTEDVGSTSIQVNWVITDVDEPQTVDYATVDGTAMAGTDYEATSGTLVFEKSDPYKEIPIVILNDGVKDPDKSFQVQLSNASSLGLGRPSVTTVVIQDPTPMIYTEPTPTNQSVSLGATVRIEVSAKGALMQWQHRAGDGEFADVMGATGMVLELRNVTVQEAGDYRIVVSSSTGESVTSQTATVTVDPTFTKITEGPLVTDAVYTWNGAWGDYDNDGLLDLVVLGDYNNSGHNTRLYHNEGNGQFRTVTNSPMGWITDRGSYCPWADTDNDGDLDLLLTTQEDSPPVFFLNLGNGEFERRPVDGSLLVNADSIRGSTCSWADYDNDGYLDAFIGVFSGTAPGTPNSVLHNNGDGTFTVDTDNTLALTGAGEETSSWVDYDNDGDLDLLAMRSSGTACRLYRNDGQGRFVEATPTAIRSAITFSLCSAWGDFDNDGDLDLYCGGINGGRSGLFVNQGDGTFEAWTGSPEAAASGVNAVWGDYDNDGHLDLFIAWVAGRNVIFRNLGDGNFEEAQVGSPVSDPIGATQTAAFVDYDNNGALDLFLAKLNGEPNSLYRNNGNSNHWLKVRLKGSTSNSYGVGARVFTSATIGGQATTQMRQITAQSALQELEAHFGLGDAEQLDVVRIEWPSGTVQEITNVTPNQILTVIEPRRPVLSGGIRASDGAFVLTVKADPDQHVVIYASGDLFDWQEAGEFTGSGEAMELSPQGTARFYKAEVR